MTAADGDRFHVRVSEERNASSVRRTLHISDHPDIWFDVAGENPPPALENFDFAAVSMLLIAMQAKKDLFIDGPVTAQCLRNLDEHQLLWLNWDVPGYYKIEITAAQIIEEPVLLKREGIFAFSGGVDGTAALLRHLDDDLGRRRIKPVGVMLVQGFDAPLRDDALFGKVEANARAMLEEFKLPFYIVRTNWRDFHGDWAMQHGPGLFAALHQFAGLADWGVLGAGEDFKHLLIPWGSSSLFNHLFSGANFVIHTECGDMTRCERLEKICKYPRVADRIRVCWENTATGLNCGKCEKCIRTQLNYLAIGVEPKCFDTPPSLWSIAFIRARARSKIRYIYESLDAATENRIAFKWRAAMMLAAVQSEIAFVLKRIKTSIRKQFSRALS